MGFYTIFVGNVKIQTDKKTAVGIHRHPTVKEIPCIKVLYFGISDEYKGKEYDNQKFSTYLMDHLKFRCGEVGMKCGVCIVHLESYLGAEKFYENENFLKIGRSGNSELNSYVYHINHCVEFVKSVTRLSQKAIADKMSKEVAPTSENS